MGEEFQAEVSWWNISSRNSAMFGSSPCSSAINLDLGSFGWPADFLDIKTRCSAKRNLDSDESNSASDGSIVIQDHFHHKPNKHQDSSSMVDSNSLQFLGSIGLSSSTTTADHWDPSLINGSPDDQSNNYPPNILQQQGQNSSMNYGQENCPPPQDIRNNFSTIDSSSSSINQQDGGYPISSVSYGFPSSLLQTLFDDAPVQQQQQQPAFYANQAMNYQMQQQNPAVNMQFPAANQNFCNSEAGFQAGFFASSQPQFLPSTFNEKANLPNFTTKHNMNDEVQGKKNVSEQAFKRPRIETPSPLPTFKVRKEKLGDRITALQQLVSPFGKTDTASVLHEAIEYIKFLHDQVNMLSTPYKKNGSPVHHRQQQQQHHQQQTSANKDGSKEDLKSKGLCLVPISSTFPVAAETTTDFWTPTFGGTFR